jgi:activator of HSP90 ATPase
LLLAKPLRCLQYEWSITTPSSPAVNALYALAKKKLPVALETKFSTFPSALLDAHGKDLTVAGYDSPSVSGTATPAAAPKSAASAPVSVSKAAEKAKAVNTSDIKTEATFMAESNDLFSLLTDEGRIPAWTRAPAKSKPEPGAEYSLFGGGVKGKYVSLEPGKKIVQTWALQSPTWPAG